MLGRTYEAQNCSAARTLEVVGERWSLLILRDALFRGMTRFTEFQRSLGVAPNVLAARLRTFVEAGLMELDPPDRSEQPRYRLTDKGRDLTPVIVALTRWGDQWAAPDGPPVRFRHAQCGSEVRQAIVCDNCDEEIQSAELTAVPASGQDRVRN
jgi:DNA-binding HxlR family transcriptional regulator